VLLIGAGGLGSPCALYLAGAGVGSLLLFVMIDVNFDVTEDTECTILIICHLGRLGIIDYDVVEKSNLHRQVIHSEKSIDTPKSASARDAISKYIFNIHMLKSLAEFQTHFIAVLYWYSFNSDVEVIAYNVLFNSSNAFDIMRPYDIIVDCSDNAVTRYLINDACILLKKPLVSGAALRLDGQLTVYGYGETCPCYRCLFPTPPPREAQGNCSDQGVLGVGMFRLVFWCFVVATIDSGAVPGIIGSLQALEVIKIAAQMDGVLAGKLLTFDASTTTVRTIKLRPRNKNCAVCGESPTIKELIDYEFFCQAKADDKVCVLFSVGICDSNLLIIGVAAAAP
jgi:adenylyltransferase/sulfurtransferase